MRFIFGFLFPSSFGGLIGVLLLNRPLDILFYDPLFVAAYFYSVLSDNLLAFTFMPFPLLAIVDIINALK